MSPTPGFRRGRRISDLMTRDYETFVDSAFAAERAGDAETALAYHRGVPMFQRSAHGVVLTQLAGLADEMTPWMWARWAAYQCTRAEDRGTGSGEITRAALDYVVLMFHRDLLQQAYDEGDDPVRLTGRIMGMSWPYHQLCTYELGGLEEFLDTLARGRLAEECGLAWDWVDATMGGYRLERTDGGLVAHDPVTGARTELLDLGAALYAGPSGWVIGRLVPSGGSPALMFDSRPLPVDEQTATACAADPSRGAWITALERALSEGRVDPSVLMSEDRELVTDVPSLELVHRGTAPSALAATLDQLARGRDEIGRAAYRILRDAVDGSLGGDDQAPYVAAAVVNPHAYAEAQRRLVGPGRRAAWIRWAELAPDPAAGRLASLAERSHAVSA
ncbi:hypothetical protein [Nocardioides dongkuii]|uniref:hypothetical protein n=1 Tax=Nocardioides dongkuii TaxID=2760089 RepID=UPI0015FA15F7|nr:hypothetical protein [Nocardioides dongkuii]